MSEKVKVTYQEYGDMLNQLVEMVKHENFHFVCGKLRGGLPIAVHVSHFLGLYMLTDLEIESGHYVHNRKFKLLVVDDIVDSGRTMIDMLNGIEKLTVKTASLYWKPHSSFKPDYYVKQTSDWIVFPWEPMEEVPNREAYKDLR